MLLGGVAVLSLIMTASPPVAYADVTTSIQDAIEELEEGRNAYLLEQYFGDISGIPTFAAQEVVQNAINLYDSQKTDYITVGDQEVRLRNNILDSSGQVAFDVINSMNSEDAVYPFVVDVNSMLMVAEGAFPSVVGLPAIFLMDADISLDDIMEDLLESDGIWVNYVYNDPLTNLYENKRSWLSLHDGYIFGAGYYTPTEEVVVDTVQDMIRAYDISGESSFDDAGSSLGSIDYSFVLDAETLEVVAPLEMPSIRDALTLGWSADMILDTLEKSDGAYFSYAHDAPTVGAEYARAWFSMHDGYIFASGYDISVEQKIRYTVFEVITMHDLHGAEETYAAITGSWSPRHPVPVVTEIVPNNTPRLLTGAIAAHGLRADLVGRPFALEADATRSDVNFSTGVWSDAFTVNKLGNDGRSTSMSVLQDNLLFSVSYFYSPHVVVKATVDGAVDMYKKYGEAAFDRINWQSTQPKVIYPYVVDAKTWETVAHATLPGRVGICCSQAIAESNDLDEVRRTLETQEGDWIEYTFYNPSTQGDEAKRVYLVTYDGYTFGSGYYFTATVNSQRLVNEMIELYETEGMAVFDTINGMMSGSDSYAFVVDADTLNIIAHGGSSNFVDTSLADYWAGLGVRSVDNVVAELNDDGTAFNVYGVMDPQTGNTLTKIVWLQLHDGYIFAASDPHVTYTR